MSDRYIQARAIIPVIVKVSFQGVPSKKQIKRAVEDKIINGDYAINTDMIIDREDIEIDSDFGVVSR